MEVWLLAPVVAMISGVVLLGTILFIVPFKIGRSIEQSADLERSFGEEEYVHVVTELGTWKGEQTLARWRTEALGLVHRGLSVGEADRFTEARSDACLHFAESPELSLVELDGLIADIERALGYPTDDFEHMAGLLCVDHPSAAHHIREAHAVAERAGRHEASAGQLQQAVTHYQAALDELVVPI